MLRKQELYEKAISLRRRGLSYNEILKVVSVGQGTISRWCHNIELDEKQNNRLLEKKRNTVLIQSLIKSALKSKEDAEVWAKDKVNNLKTKTNGQDLLPFTAALLYWAEGAKLNEQISKGIEFTNTDPRMIKIILSFFREIMKIPEQKIKIVVRIGEKGDLEKAKHYWSEITRVSLENFKKPELLKLTEKSKSLIKYPYGMCRVVIYDVSTARKVHELIENFYTEFFQKI